MYVTVAGLTGRVRCKSNALGSNYHGIRAGPAPKLFRARIKNACSRSLSSPPSGVLAAGTPRLDPPPPPLGTRRPDMGRPEEWFRFGLNGAQPRRRIGVPGFESAACWSERVLRIPRVKRLKPRIFDNVPAASGPNPVVVWMGSEGDARIDRPWGALAEVAGRALFAPATRWVQWELGFSSFSLDHLIG